MNHVEQFAPSRPASFLERHGLDRVPVDDVPSYKAVEKTPREKDIPKMFGVKLGNGNELSMPYAYMTRALCNPSIGLIVQFPDVRIKVRGRNLKAIYAEIIRHRAVYIAEAETQYNTLGEDDPFIEKIDIDITSVDQELLF